MTLALPLLAEAAVKLSPAAPLSCRRLPVGLLAPPLQQAYLDNIPSSTTAMLQKRRTVSGTSYRGSGTPPASRAACSHTRPPGLAALDQIRDGVSVALPFEAFSLQTESWLKIISWKRKKV